MAKNWFPLHVVVYTEPGSVRCEQVKEFLRVRDIPFVDKDITQDLTAVGELREIGHLTVPVTRVGQDVIVGYDEAALEHHFGAAPEEQS
jgi:glutaredoxin 3